MDEQEYRDKVNADVLRIYQNIKRELDNMIAANNECSKQLQELSDKIEKWEWECNW